MAKAKVKKAFFCKNCGYESPKYMGKCPSCNQWNTFTEEVIHKDTSAAPDWGSKKANNKVGNKAKPIAEIEYEDRKRIITQDEELNRVLGGGIVHGSLVLIGGEPGVGKSTLMLQIALSLSKHKILYVSGEESESQIKMRADRIGFSSNQCFILSETSTTRIFTQIKETDPDVLIIDSIQTLQSSVVDAVAGSISQVRESTAELLKYAKESGTPVFLIGHITKDGNLAGPKVLEHMVDTVLQFEGDRNMSYRIIRTIKNRFGSTSELGIYEMLGAGLRQVSNPSEILISQKEDNLSGIAIGASVEGNRPLLIEIQALVSNSTYNNPQRSSTGFDVKRLNMLLAVLEKRGNYRLGTQDVFLNIAGGLKVSDPALDLAICASLISSFEELDVAHDYAFAGEVGLGGEVRAVNRIESRIAEAEKLGFKAIFISKYNKLNQEFVDKSSIKIGRIKKLDELFTYLFG
ncbi:MAG: DNA repair protein RadA [Cytophagales bacterium]|nr:DNA repair protein RadA [Cytophagales bacterium]